MTAAPSRPDTATPLDLNSVRIDSVQALRLPASIALRRRLLPFAVHEGCVWLASQMPEDEASLRTLQRYFDHPLRAVSAEPASLTRALERLYRDAPQGGVGTLARYTERGAATTAVAGEEAEGDARQVAADILRAAMLRHASDIHLDPGEKELRVRLRVDGELEDAFRLPMSLHAAILNRFKILAGLNIAEKRSPQDGSFRHQEGGVRGQMVDVRVATLPARHGERLTLRLMAVDSSRFSLGALGMSEQHHAMFSGAIAKPHGLILLTGPTGSGKTTTLYAAIRELMAAERLNIITVEDPVENEIPGIVQVEVDSADKVSFSSALRSLLRHDPDVVMIGEIRDRETADIAIKAALTGHLVFSTLHTNSAAGAVVRLAEMGVERFLIASTLRLTVAQRLVRKCCAHCIEPRSLRVEDAAFLGRPQLEGQAHYEPQGCLHCGGRGFAGRVGLFEMLPVDEEWSQVIAEGAGEAALIERMRQRRLPLLVDDAAEKLLAGSVTLTDVRGAVTVW
ncbi:MAG: GspE/PulE family protein [Prosthecobacter sp.]